jgi:hypothetical protein
MFFKINRENCYWGLRNTEEVYVEIIRPNENSKTKIYSV